MASDGEQWVHFPLTILFACYPLYFFREAKFSPHYKKDNFLPKLLQMMEIFYDLLVEKPPT
jgi:hypothetical protein